MDPNNAAMAGLINGLPPAPAPGNDGGIFGQPAQPLFGGQPAPAAPAMPYPTAPPPAPAPQYVTPGYPAAPVPAAPAQTPGYYPPVPTATPGQPAAPTGPLPEYPPIPGLPYQAPGLPDNSAQVIQELTEQVQTLQQQVGSGAGDPNDWPDRPRTWGGMKQAIQQMADQVAETKVKAFVDAQEQARTEQATQYQEANRQLDYALGQLHQVGILPPVANPADPNDPGKLAERELIGYAMSMGGQTIQDLSRAAPSLRAHHDAGYYFDYQRGTLVRRGSQSAAASAPIAGGTPVMGGGGPVAPGPSQADFTMPLDQLMQVGMQRLGQ